MNNSIKITTVMTVLAIILATTMVLKVQSVSALGVPCSGCAKDFTPGQEAKSPGDAKNFAPGQEALRPTPCPNCDINAKDFAPGQEKIFTK